jgi:hypothetical protein
VQRIELNNPTVDLKNPEETLQCIIEIFGRHFPGQSPQFLTVLFKKVCDFFAGRYTGYQACDTLFHDLSHTCQASVATARILDGHIVSGANPKLTARDFELCIAGIWLHDIGFIKEAGDMAGTGAKYTRVHVERSARLAGWFLPLLGVSTAEVRIIQNAIRCTGTNVNTTDIEFHDERERLIGYALGTGDILGQMASPDYPDKLPKLYDEFLEAGIVPQEGDHATFASADDMLVKTRQFYEVVVINMLKQQWGSVAELLVVQSHDGRNHYIDAIERNLNRIDRLFARD